MPSTIRNRMTKIEKKFEKSIDQVLLGLQHRGLNLKEFSFKESSDIQDVIQKVGRRVLQRAEEIRAQLADRPYSPAWLKDVSLMRTGSNVEPMSQARERFSDEGNPNVKATGAEASMADATVSKAAKGMLADDAKKVAAQAKKRPLKPAGKVTKAKSTAVTKKATSRSKKAH